MNKHHHFWMNSDTNFELLLQLCTQKFYQVEENYNFELCSKCDRFVCSIFDAFSIIGIHMNVNDIQNQFSIGWNNNYYRTPQAMHTCRAVMMIFGKRVIATIVFTREKLLSEGPWKINKHFESIWFWAVAIQHGYWFKFHCGHRKNSCIFNNKCITF